MKVIIWDLDYYYAKKRVNCFNPDAMKISSYHKQLGDSVVLVETQDDIYRPCDLYYLIKEKTKTPMPPKEFFLNPKVRWWGKAFQRRINWKMTDAMLGCRSDYLLYPEKNTKLEQAEHVRLFNDKMQLIQLYQNWSNSYTNKFLVVTDNTKMWFASNKDIKIALKRIQEGKNVSFLEPIYLQKLIYDKELKEEFLKLKFVPGSNLKLWPIKKEDFELTKEFIKEFKSLFPYVKIGPVILDYRDKTKSHWDSIENARADFQYLRETICRCKKEEIMIEVRMPQSRFETPYFHLFEELASWSKFNFRESWLEFITKKYGSSAFNYWAHPEMWSETFRDLLRQTYFDHEFITAQWGNDKISDNDIPWMIWEKEFIIGL